MKAFYPAGKIAVLKQHPHKPAFFLLLLAVISALLSACMLSTVRCIVVRVHEGEIVFIARVTDGDPVIISHTNSIYDAHVEEHLEVRDNSLVLLQVATDSEGVKEYYGIADGMHAVEWSIIRVLRSGERNFSLRVKEIMVDAFQVRNNTRFVIELKKMPFYSYILQNLHLSI